MEAMVWVGASVTPWLERPPSGSSKNFPDLGTFFQLHPAVHDAVYHRHDAP